MTAEIYYFTGTGNSLFIAREMQKRLTDARLIPIVSLIHLEWIESCAETIGLVFPVQALTLPIVLKRFLRKARFPSARYIFAIATRHSTVFRGFEWIDRLLKRQGRKLDAHCLVNMCHSDSRHEGYVVPGEAEIRTLEEAALKKLDAFAENVNRRSPYREVDAGYSIRPGRATEKIVLWSMAASEYIGGVNYFYADSRCTGCRICERVCPSRKIRLNGKRPEWHRNVLCYMCFACLNYCPVRSVQIRSIPGVKSGSTENGRYPHPYATVNDIAAHKEFPFLP